MVLRIARVLACLVMVAGGNLPTLMPSFARAEELPYTFYDLGESAQYDANDPACPVYARGGEGISPSGIVVGQLRTSSGRIVPAISKNSVHPQMKGLSSPGVGGSARAINAAGVVVGQINVKTDATLCGDYRRASQPSMWVDGKRTELPTGDSSNGRADAINDAGVIVGLVTGTQGEVQPASWVDGELQVLPLPESDMVGGNAYGINTDGVIVGSCFLIDQLSQYAYDFATVWQDGKASKLDIGDGTASVAYGINDAGVIAGGITTGASGAERQEAALWTDGKPTLLPTIDGAIGTVAFAVNAQGDAVGMAQTNDGRVAVVWHDGKLALVDDLAGKPKGWEFWAAKDISDNGSIVGYGLVDGEIHGYLVRIEMSA